MRRFWLGVLVGCGLAAPQVAVAQEGPLGIAFVQAPEQSWGMGLAATPEAAFDLAVAQCVAGGALAEDCLRTNWCHPAGWSVDLFLMHREGLHWHEVVCGLPEESVARAVAAAVCDQGARPYITECALVQLYDRDGAPQIKE